LDLELWVDAGLRDASSVEALRDLDGDDWKAVIGLETVQGPGALREIIGRVGTERAIFSLDLFEGRPLSANLDGWRTADPLALARRAIDLGAAHVLILDLARVGTDRGVGAARLIGPIHERDPGVKISLGGGVSGLDDLRALQAAGAWAALVGSAIHDGRVGRSELDRLESARCDRENRPA
jgi:phosphoribosylformimino-5-aminoimidazole carboxamide ribotide isomerase